LGTSLAAERGFFGSYNVRTERGGVYRSLTHGTTLHGLQSIDPARRAEPLSYYHREGPLGDVFRQIPIAATSEGVAVVGLGVGSMSTYRRGAQHWTFFEIDPAVERIARRLDFFTYLGDCGGSCNVVLGDARQSLRVSPARYGVIVLDAFSSDAIPMHLVTREAIDLYLSRLVSGGVLVMHISNRHLNLEPVLATLADRAGLISVIRRDHAEWDEKSGKTGSEWMVMAREIDDLGRLSTDRRWRRSDAGGSVPVWTDDFSNILTLLMRR
jgi:hypothetical protein